VDAKGREKGMTGRMRVLDAGRDGPGMAEGERADVDIGAEADFGTRPGRRLKRDVTGRAISSEPSVSGVLVLSRL
jgi:hypothetical protein